MTCKPSGFCDPQRPMGRCKFLRALLIALVVLCVAAGGAVFYLSREMNRAADGFFTAIGNAKLPMARTFLSAPLRSETGAIWLKRLLADGELFDPESTEWTGRKSANGYGELTGTVTRRTGSVVPVTLLFVREKLAWKLYAIRRPFTGGLPQPMAPLLPDRKEQVALVKRAMSDFAASVQTRNMSYFRSTLAPSRRDQYTTAQLDEAFGRFFDIPEDLASLARVEPSVSETTRSAQNGDVTLSGYFPTTPRQVHFLQKYAYEQTDWRLLSFKIDMQ
jgi:hypothetical protein